MTDRASTPTRPATTAVGPPPRARFHAQRKRRGLAEDAIFTIGWASVAAAVTLYLAYGGLTDLGTPKAVLRGLGVVAGLVATDLICLQLLLAARIPFVDRAIGHDSAIHTHGTLGKWSYIALGVHFVALLVGYALSDGLDIVAEFVQLWTFGDFVLGVIAFVILLAVGVTCFRAIREITDHDLWWLIHLALYVGVLMSLPHMFSMSGVLGPDNWQHWYWIALLLLTFFSLLMWRVFLPLFSSIEHRIRVSSVVREAEDVVTITMEGHRLDELHTAAGQFFHWRFLAPGLWWHQHPFSVSAMPRNNQLRITVRNLGAGTARLMRVPVGTRVFVEGPYGIFTDRARTQEGLVLVGFGIGIAPIRALLEETDFHPGLATVILRASRKQEMFLAREVEELCRRRGARFVALQGHRSRRAGGWLPESVSGRTLVDFAPNVAASDVYVCGPTGAADLVAAEALAAGTPPESIHSERFSW